MEVKYPGSVSCPVRACRAVASSRGAILRHLARKWDIGHKDMLVEEKRSDFGLAACAGVKGG